jgi:hypothetical protein
MLDKLLSAWSQLAADRSDLGSTGGTGHYTTETSVYLFFIMPFRTS